MATDTIVLQVAGAGLLLGAEHMQAEGHEVYSSVRDRAELSRHEFLQLVILVVPCRFQYFHSQDGQNTGLRRECAAARFANFV